MKIHFYKYQGAGNDFVLIDNRNHQFDGSNNKLVNQMCDRRFGIGADGLMLLENHDTLDFTMRYFNSDGREASMCGNGGRCIVAFAKRLGLINHSTAFMAVDGEHEASIDEKELVNLRMIDVKQIEIGDDYYFLNTGSPHYVRFVDDINTINVVEEGKKVRYNDRFRAEGTNVNFVEIVGNSIKVFTYERGVEDETLACGTGITASAICAGIKTNQTKASFPVLAKGGNLEVSFEKAGEGFTNIYLKGPATYVFEGEFTI
ncbi:MAG: diaminopimelate epimerase [Bacteroidota bacterium]|nr:diaminopimelate epimerase [Bacteroidota bacterium]MDP4206535.1 diaminopimelate epimerase [Bacteroidota bacterium]